MPPTATLSTPASSSLVAAAAAAPGFGEPRIVSRSQQQAPLEPAHEAIAIQDFETHLDGAFEEATVAADTDVAAAAVVPEAVTRFQGDSLNLKTLCASWADFTEVVRGSKAMLAHCLSEGKPHSLQNGVLAIWFSAEHAFHLNLMREARTLRELEAHLQQFFGKHLKVDLRDGAQDTEISSVPDSDAARVSARLTPEDVAQSRRDAAEDALQQTPRLQEILDAFDGEILEDNQT